MRLLAHHANLGYWFMWILAAVLAMGLLFSSITASQSHAQDCSSGAQAEQLPQ